jgi:hypothetical protein
MSFIFAPRSLATRLLVNLFDRKYRPKWRWTPDGTVVPADPTEWINGISGERWSYTDHADLLTRRRITAAVAMESGIAS